jgi:hypothetical protein
MAAAAGDESQRHQAAADAEREDHAEDQGDPAMDADADRIEAGQDPGRPGKRQEQQEDEEGDEEAGPQS